MIESPTPITNFSTDIEIEGKKYEIIFSKKLNIISF